MNHKILPPVFFGILLLSGCIGSETQKNLDNELYSFSYNSRVGWIEGENSIDKIKIDLNLPHYDKSIAFGATNTMLGVFYVREREKYLSKMSNKYHCELSKNIFEEYFAVSDVSEFKNKNNAKFCGIIFSDTKNKNYQGKLAVTACSNKLIEIYFEGIDDDYLNKQFEKITSSFKCKEADK